MYKNLSLEDIVTPINVGVYESLLRSTKFDETETNFLINVFTQGFDLCYTGPLNR